MGGQRGPRADRRIEPARAPLAVRVRPLPAHLRPASGRLDRTPRCEHPLDWELTAAARLAPVPLGGGQRAGHPLAAQPAAEGGGGGGRQAGERRAQAQAERRHLDLRPVARDRPEHRPGHVLGRACAHAGRQPHARLGEHSRLPDEAGQHDRDADPVRAQVLAQGVGEAAQAELGRRVDRGGGGGGLARQRGDEHDMALAAGDHPRHERPGEGDRRAQVDLQHAVDLLLLELHQPAGGGQRRVGHQHVDLPRLGHQPLQLGPVGEVTHHRPCPQPPRQRLEHLGAAAAQHQAGAVRGERLGDRATQAAGRAGDQHPAIEQRHGASVWAALVDRTGGHPAASEGAGRRAGAARHARSWRVGLPGHTARVARAAVIALFGPTGVGKTEVAAALARRLRELGERPVAVSADALQVYRGLELLTGASDARAQPDLEHRLISFVALHETFSAGRYARLAHAEIDSLLAAGGRPIVVGGTGLYLRAALAELDLRPPPAPGARERWRAELERLGAPALHARLQALAPWAAAAIHPGDSQRIMRALELQEAGQLRPGPARSQLWTSATRHPTLLVGLTLEREQLYRRIDRRVERIVAAGAREEVLRAIAAGASSTARRALGFQELAAGDIEALKRRTRNYARRQLTWLRKLPAVELLDLTDRTAEAAATRILQLWRRPR